MSRQASMLSGPVQAGLATHEPTTRLAPIKAHKPHVRAACAGPLKAARVSLA